MNGTIASEATGAVTGGLRTMLRLAMAGRDIAVIDDQLGTPTDALQLATLIAEMTDRLADGSSGPFGTFCVNPPGEESAGNAPAFCNSSPTALVVVSEFQPNALFWVPSKLFKKSPPASTSA